MLEDAAWQEVLEDASQGYVNDPQDYDTLMAEVVDVLRQVDSHELPKRTV